VSGSTSRDVARLVGVSQSTVSYVLSGKRPVSESTRTKVLAAIEQLTYHPNAGARALASQRASVIGLVVPFGPGADTAGILPFIETIALSARQRDHELLLVTSSEGSDGLRRLAGRKLCDAIVLMDIGWVDERVAVAAQLGVPIVLIGVPEDAAGLHCVDADFPAAARLAVDELAATGHDRILLIGHPAEVISQDLNFVRRFADAAEEAADRHGIPFEQVAPVEWGRAGARDAVGRVLARWIPGERLGLLVPNAQAVHPVLHALAARGVVPGRDVSVIAVLSDLGAEETEPPVTNVSVAPHEVSRRAMETLFWLLDPIDWEEPPPVELVPPRLTRRETVMSRP
jgi:DNA-binding LacI/PurR family transcriptional regulator